MDVAEMALYAGQTSNIIYPDTPEKTKKMKLCTSVYFNENLRLVGEIFTLIFFHRLVLGSPSNHYHSGPRQSSVTQGPAHH